jgi:hypothetical protein
MDKLLRLLLCLGLLTCFTVDTDAADLTLSIAELTRQPNGPLGETARADASAPGDFTLSMPTSPGTPGWTVVTTGSTVITTLAPLECPEHQQTPKRPCTVYFPSKSRTPDPANDRFAFSDACGVGHPTLPDCDDLTIARVIKTDSSTDNVEVSGLQIKALKQNTETWIKLVASTGGMQGGSNSGSFAFSAILSGTFTTLPPTGASDVLVDGCIAPLDANDTNYDPACVNGCSKSTSCRQIREWTHRYER